MLVDEETESGFLVTFEGVSLFFESFFFSAVNLAAFDTTLLVDGFDSVIEGFDSFTLCSFDFVLFFGRVFAPPGS